MLDIATRAVGFRRDAGRDPANSSSRAATECRRRRATGWTSSPGA